MKVLVTGSSGFIGGHLVEKLAGRGDEVQCLVRKTSRTRELERLNVRLVIGDCRDKESLRPAVKNMDYVFHLAGVINALDWQTYHEVNTLGTQNLLEACQEENAGLRKFVFVSSISAAGPSPCGASLREEDECHPVSDYGRSKLEAERFVLGRKDRQPVVIIRPSNILGPRQRELMYSIRLLRMGIMPVVGSGSLQTSLASVFDVVEALILAAENPRSAGQVYFITDGRAYAWSEITEAITEGLGVKKFYLKVPYAVQVAAAALSEALARARKKTPLLSRQHLASSRKYCWVYDGTKIERELGFKPTMDMKAAVRSALDWARESRFRGHGRS